jgi:Prohead core protein serine protease
MYLITETNHDAVRLLTESNDKGEKQYFIEGIFMQSEVKNRNGRVYPEIILNKEVQRYADEFVSKNRAMGELGHPDGPTVNLERVSHIIKDLRVEGNDVYGKAKILETPMGKIAKNLLNEGCMFGVSSRGMGSLQERNGVNYVQDDFMLASVDIVADPSAPNAFVNGIMEGKEWVWDNGIIKELQIEKYKKIVKNSSRRDLEENTLKVFKDFMSKL